MERSQGSVWKVFFCNLFNPSPQLTQHLHFTHHSFPSHYSQTLHAPSSRACSLASFQTRRSQRPRFGISPGPQVPHAWWPAGLAGSPPRHSRWPERSGSKWTWEQPRRWAVSSLREREAETEEQAQKTVPSYESTAWPTAGTEKTGTLWWTPRPACLRLVHMLLFSIPNKERFRLWTRILKIVKNKKCKLK